MQSKHDFYVPKTKPALVKWLHIYGKKHRSPNDAPITPEHERAIIAGWNRLTKPQLYAVFFKLRAKHDNPKPTTTATKQLELF